MKNLLVCVDYQNDFVTGALGFEAAQKLCGGIAARVKAQLESGGYLIFTRDTRTDNYLNTPEGKFLPVPHCIKGTYGHSLFGELARYENEPCPNMLIVDKPTFGCAEIAEKAAALCGGTPDKIELCGVVTNICVISNAILLQTAFPNAEIIINSPLCAAIGTAHENALEIMRGLGMTVL